MTILLVRHGKAGERDEWTGPDRLRPLSEAGRRQADVLVELLAGMAVERILSSAFTRCVETVDPLARARGLEVEHARELEEGQGYQPLLDVVARLGATPAVLCSHGDVIHDLLHHLEREGWKPDGPVHAAKGSTWVFDVENGMLTRPRYLPAPD